MKLDSVNAVAFSISFSYKSSSFPLQPNCYKIKLLYLFVYLFTGHSVSFHSIPPQGIC